MGTTVLRMMMYDQKVRKPEKTALLWISFHSKNTWKFLPTRLSQIVFPMAKITPIQMRKAKIWNIESAFYLNFESCVSRYTDVFTYRYLLRVVWLYTDYAWLPFYFVVTVHTTYSSFVLAQMTSHTVTPEQRSNWSEYANKWTYCHLPTTSFWFIN